MKTLLFLATVIVLPLAVWTQQTNGNTEPNITVKWAPTGLLLGSASLQAEYNFGSRNSLTAKIGAPLNVKHSVRYNDGQVGFNMKGTSFLAGYRTYLSEKHLRGFYYEPFFKYVHHTSEGDVQTVLDGRNASLQLMNNYSGTGIGIQFGTQLLLGKRFVVDLFFIGPEINMASNSFKAFETSSSLPWTQMEGIAGANEVRSFLNRFPFIRNRSRIITNNEFRRITADFRGALPGIRTGVAVGLAF